VNYCHAGEIEIERRRQTVEKEKENGTVSTRTKIPVLK
jgi:hypothetical protein